MERVVADHRYDATRTRASLHYHGAIPVISSLRKRKRTTHYHKRGYKDRWDAAGMFCDLKDLRRIAKRYGKLARNFLLTVRPRCRDRLLAVIEFRP